MSESTITRRSAAKGAAGVAAAATLAGTALSAGANAAVSAPSAPTPKGRFVLSYPNVAGYAGVYGQGYGPVSSRDYYLYHDSVRNIQRRLGLSQDGIFGSGTAASVRNFQRIHGLSQDGVVGPATASRLGLRWQGTDPGAE